MAIGSNQYVLSGLRRDSLLGHGSYGGKCFCIAHGEVGKHLAVNGDTRKAEPMDQLAVWKTVQAAGGIDALNPEATHVALTIAAISVRVLKGAHEGLMCPLEQTVTSAAMALYLEEDLAVSAMSGYAALDTCHDENPVLLAVRSPKRPC
jgi:hypothetical protein